MDKEKTVNQINKGLLSRKEYNLLDEGWISVMYKDSRIRKVSLLKAFEDSRDILRITCETESMNVSILRLLLAITQTVMWRYDMDGDEEDVEDADDVLDRVKEYFNEGKLPYETVKSYLEQFRERFWLLHPTQPFYQSCDTSFGTVYENMAPIFGNVKESKNSATMPHYRISTGEAYRTMAFDEAARWLIHFQAYAFNIKVSPQDKIGKAALLKSGKDPGSEKGPLASAGIILYHGKNLFETIMLNLCALMDGDTMWSEPPVPEWEEPVRAEIHCPVPFPGNIPQYYTLQKRRMRLYPEGDRIVGCCCADGDFYDGMSGRFFEQMTLWRAPSEKGEYFFQSHFVEKQVWREFPVMFGHADFEGTEARRTPGVVLWFRKLEQCGLIPEDRVFPMQAVGVKYDDSQGYLFDDIYSDVIDMSGGLLSEKGRVWEERISVEVQKCEKTAWCITKCVDDIFKFLNKGKGAKDAAQKLCSAYFSELDVRFRKWVMEIDPQKQDMDEKVSEWREINRGVAKQVVNEYLDTMSYDHYRYQNGLSRYAVENMFSGTLNSILGKRKENK